MSGKLPGVPVREFRKTLEDNGFKYDRSNSGHEIWERKQSVSIPVHSKEMKIIQMMYCVYQKNWLEKVKEK